MAITPNDPANFSPTLQGYTGQGAFRFWCQTVLPLVYDDSLSYYELLNKVVNYLNNVISDVSQVETNVGEIVESYNDLEAYVNSNYLQLVETYNQLENYVNDYFENLDVQNEINTKLDEMASSGALSVLIAPIVPQLVADWLAENITPTTPAVDATLSVQGAAADAKKTGEMVAPVFDPTANYIAGDYVNYGGTIYVFSQNHNAGAWTGSDVIAVKIGEEVYDLKSALINDSNGVLSLDKLTKQTPYATSNGWKIISGGLCASDTNYKLIKCRVTAGIPIFIWCFNSNVKIQFQNSDSVPSYEPSNVVGDEISDGYCGVLGVPIGARFIIFSTLTEDNNTGVYFTPEVLARIESDNTQKQLENKEKYDLFYINPVLERGGLNEGINGAITDVTNRLRSKDFLYAVTSNLKVELPDGMQWFPIEYDDTLTLRKTPESWISGDWTLTYPYFKFVLRNSDNSDIQVSDASGFNIYAGYVEPLFGKLPYSVFEQIIPSATASGWKLTNSGVSASDSDYELIKYYVDGLTSVFIRSDHIFQFQNSVYVPADYNTYIIGSPIVGEAYQKYDIPTGTTYIILSRLKTKQYDGIYKNMPFVQNNNFTQKVSPVLMEERYIGHRGGGKTAPENTIPGLQQGFDNGFKILEIDIQFTSDNVPVVLHDTTINRTARNADGTSISNTVNISDITYAQSQDYDFGVWKGEQYVGTKLPKLDDVLLFAKKHGCAVECDVYSTENMTKAKANILYNVVKNRGMTGEVMFTGLYTSTLMLFEDHADICVCCSGVSTAESYAQEASTYLQKSMYTMCSVQDPYMTDDQVKYIHQHGMKAKAFTISTNTTANTSWEHGVDKMILDGIYPSEII